jgi:hypothetical protein
VFSVVQIVIGPNSPRTEFTRSKNQEKWKFMSYSQNPYTKQKFKAGDHIYSVYRESLESLCILSALMHLL